MRTAFSGSRQAPDGETLVVGRGSPSTRDAVLIENFR